jgi:hypothetical protein
VSDDNLVSGWNSFEVHPTEYNEVNQLFMKWVVLEEDPKPDEYIAIMVTDEIRKLQLEQKAHSIFSTSDEAVRRARIVRDLFGVKTIRIFHWESYSSPT